MNDLSIKNIGDIQSCEAEIKHKCSNTTSSVINHIAHRIASTSVIFLNFHKTTILSPVGKEYMCFHNDSKTSQVPGVLNQG